VSVQTLLRVKCIKHCCFCAFKSQLLLYVCVCLYVYCIYTRFPISRSGNCMAPNWDRILKKTKYLYWRQAFNYSYNKGKLWCLAPFLSFHLRIGSTVMCILNKSKFTYYVHCVIYPNTIKLSRIWVFLRSIKHEINIRTKKRK